MSLPIFLGREKYTIHLALLGKAEEVPVHLVIVLVIRGPNFFWRVIVDFLVSFGE